MAKFNIKKLQEMEKYIEENTKDSEDYDPGTMEFSVKIDASSLSPEVMKKILGEDWNDERAEAEATKRFEAENKEFEEIAKKNNILICARYKTIVESGQYAKLAINTIVADHDRRLIIAAAGHIVRQILNEKDYRVAFLVELARIMEEHEANLRRELLS